MEHPEYLIIIAVSILASAFFSGMEIAFVSANRFQVELEKQQGKFAPRVISFFLDNPKKFIGAMLVGNNIALVVYGIYMGRLIMGGLENITGMTEFTHPTSSLLIQTFISTIVILVTAEFLPKAFFRNNPNTWLGIFSVPLMLAYGILYIPALVVTGISRVFLKAFFKADLSNEIVEFGKVDLDHFLKEATKNADPEEELDHEIQIFQNALDFSKVKARDCLIPRTELIAVHIDDEVDILRQKFIETGLSKILVFRENIDKIIGYVHSYELFKKPESLKNILRPIAIVPEPMPANEVLEQFIAQRKNMAVVVDEFGGTSGVITMEDIVEEIFGEIEDEFDKEELMEKELQPNFFEFSGRLEIDYLNEKYKLEIPESEHYDTLAGWIIHHYENIPEPGTHIPLESFEIEVIKVSNTRIELVQLLVRG